MEQKIDIKETKELIVLILEVGKATKKSFEDNKFEASDFANYFSVIPKLQPAFDGISNVPAEIKDMDTDELNELLAMVAPEVGELANAPKLVAQVEAALKLIAAAREFYVLVK